MRPLSLTVPALALAALTAAWNRGTPTAQDRAATLVTAVTSVHADADASSLSNFVAHITGASEVPPRDTRGVGELKLQLSPDGNTLEYHLISSNIRNVVASHIHLAPTGVNGPIVVFLFGSVPSGGGVTDTSIRRHRPGARGRRVGGGGGGGIVRWQQVWHPGADSATTIQFSRDVLVQGRQLAAGRYTLWAIPDSARWTVIFSRAVDVFHRPYPGESLDVLRVTA